MSCRRRCCSTHAGGLPVTGAVLVIGAALMLGTSGMADDATAAGSRLPMIGESLDHVDLVWPLLDVYAEHLARLTGTDAIASGVFVEIPPSGKTVLAGLRGYTSHAALVVDDRTNRLDRLAARQVLIGCGTSLLCQQVSNRHQRPAFLKFRRLTVTRIPNGVMNHITTSSDQLTVVIEADGQFHPGRLLSHEDSIEPARAEPDGLLPIAFRLQVSLGAGQLAATLELGPHDPGSWATSAEVWLQRILGPERSRALLASGVLTRGHHGGTLTLAIRSGPGS